jgi:hypothetical protein
MTRMNGARLVIDAATAAATEATTTVTTATSATTGTTTVTATSTTTQIKSQPRLCCVAIYYRCSATILVRKQKNARKTTGGRWTRGQDGGERLR